MLKLKSIAIMLCAGSLLAVPCFSQQPCDGCNGGFGYPGIQHGGNRGNFQSRHAKAEAWKAESDKVALRNDVWPKPFACLDRTAYHTIFDTMIHAGYETQCILGDLHFDKETNELNSHGQATVSAIMQNMPNHRKQVFISQSSDQQVTTDRIAQVNQMVSTYYSHIAPNATVIASNRQPAYIPGARADLIVRGIIDSAPAPMIPVVNSGGSIRATGAQ